MGHNTRPPDHADATKCIIETQYKPTSSTHCLNHCDPRTTDLSGGRVVRLFKDWIRGSSSSSPWSKENDSGAERRALAASSISLTTSNIDLSCREDPSPRSSVEVACPVAMMSSGVRETKVMLVNT